MKSEDMAGDPEMDNFLEMTLLMPDTTCATCYAEFLDAEDLNLHVKQMHSLLSPKNCQFCTSTYTNMWEYAAHIRDTHLMDLRCCCYCTKTFLDGGKLISHERKHYGPNYLYSCSQCNVKFQKQVLVEEHERKHHDNELDGCFLKCMPCLTAILNIKAVEFLQTSSKKAFICSCHFESVSLKAHMKHLKEKKCQGFVCDRCSGLFMRRKNIINHMNSTKKCFGAHNFKEDGPIVCTDCGIEVHPKYIKMHKKNCKAFKCVDCDIICESIDELSAHQTKEHPLDMNVVQCTFCLKEFIGQLPLKKHIVRVHKPNFHLYKYKCVQCNVIFKHPQKLFAHFFTTHKELQPYTCKICDKKFRVRKSFTLHIKLDHKSVGFVEFNDQYHVFFTASKSDKPFIPECVVPDDMYELDCDGGAQNESDTDATEAETEDDKKPVKRKLTPRQVKSKLSKNKTNTEPVLIYSSDEEPLLEVKKRAIKKKKKRRQPWKKNGSKNLFSCDICNKNCYTYQNHQNHMSLHNKNLEVECVKCLQKFHSKDNLTKHINKEHASSKLTETLKNILQKKMLDDEPINENVPLKKPNKFTISMKKVKIDKSEVPATITAVDEPISVKNFLENFTPDINEAPGKAKAGLVSIAPCTGSKIKPRIKLTKFKEEPIVLPVSLKMPERFKHEHYVKTNVSVKLIEENANDSVLPDYMDHNYTESFQDYDNDGSNMEVAHEVSLEGTEEPSRIVPTKIVIPKMPKGSKIHVATMYNEAPFFRIIKVDADDLNEENEEEASKSDVINLAGGKRLVTANPLAHLLGNTPLKKIMEPLKNKHYKPVVKDFQSLLAQAMNKLQEPPMPKKRKPKVKQSTNTE